MSRQSASMNRSSAPENGKRKAPPGFDFAGGSQPPNMIAKDFDPATYDPEEDPEDYDMRDEETNLLKVEMSSVEINILIYLYLLESNLSHTAFTLLSESQLPQTSLFRYYNPQYPTPSSASTSTSTSASKSRANGTGTSKSPTGSTFGKSDQRLPRGELIRKLWKALRWESIERHVKPNGEPYDTPCPNPFHLLLPHICPADLPSATSNPPLPLPSALMSVSPPPSKAPEAFPPPEGDEDATTNEVTGGEEPTAGPSRSRVKKRDESTQTDNNALLNKRRSRRLSIGSDSKNEGSIRSASPAVTERSQGVNGAIVGKGKKGKKRVRVSEGSEAENIRQQPKRAKDKDIQEDEAMDLDEQPEPEREGDDGEGNAEVDEDKPVAGAKGKGKAGVNGDAGSRQSDDGSVSKTKVTLKIGKSKRREAITESEDAADEEQGESKKVSPLDFDDSLVSVHNEHRDAINCLSWNPQNLDVIGTGSGDGTARLWDFRNNTDDSPPKPSVKPIVMSHKSIDSGRKSVTCMAWHPDGTILATGSQDGVGRLFTPGGTLQGIMSYGRGVINSLKFSPSGSKVLVASRDFTTTLFLVGNSYNQEMRMCFDAHTKEVNDVDWLDDHVFATGGNDRTIFVFRDNDKRPRFTLKGHTDDVTRIAWSPPSSSIKPESGSDEVSHRLLASVSDDGYCFIWKLPSYPEDRGTSSRSRSISPVKPVGPPAAATSTSSAPGTAAGPGAPGGGNDGDNDYFASGASLPGIDHCLHKLSVVDNSENRRMDTVQWSPACSEGRMILAAGGQDSTVKLFDALSGQCLHVLSGFESGIGSISFSPLAQNLIAVGGWNARLGVYDVDSGTLVKEHEIHEEPSRQSSRERPMMLAMSWRKDGSTLAVGMFNKSLLTLNVGGLGGTKTEDKAS